MATLHESGIMDVTLYGADNSGNPDNAATTTAAIREVMEAAYWGRMVVFFPPGIYDVDGTLLGQQEENNYRLRGHLLVGSTKGARPTIRLIDNAPGFQDVDNPKAIVHLYTVADDDNPDPDDEEADMGFSQGLRNINIDVGNENPGAIALRFAGAQDCILENLTMVAEGGFAGFYNLPGTNAVLTNLEVIGGRYGIYAAQVSSHWVSISGLTLIGQTDYALRNIQMGVISGFKIVKDAAPVIQVLNTYWAETYAGGAVCFIDGTINVAQTSAIPLIENTDERGVVLKNVYTKRGTEDWVHIEEDITVIKELSDTDNQQVGRTLIDGVEGTESILTTGLGTPPSDLISRHVTPTANYPSPDVILEAIENGTLINGMTVANGADDIPGLQDIIDNYDLVFLPKGNHEIISPGIVLDEDTHLMGIANHLSRIDAHPDWKPTSPATMIKTVDSATAKTKMSYMGIHFPTNPAFDWFTALEWRAGKGVYKNVMVWPVWASEEGGNPKNDNLITGNGGGKFYGFNTYNNGRRAHHPEHRGLAIIGTHNPLIFYALNVEDGLPWQMEIRNSQNIAIYEIKSEDKEDLLITGMCNNIISFGHGGSVEIEVQDSNNIYMANINPKKWTRWGTVDELDSRKILTEDYYGDFTEFSADRVIALFTRGVADFDIFNDVPVEEQLLAAFTFLEDPENLGTVDFTDLSTGTIDSWEWDFGDDGESTIPNPSHTYLAPGTYDVYLTVRNFETNESSTTGHSVVISVPGKRHFVLSCVEQRAWLH